MRRFIDRLRSAVDRAVNRQVRRDLLVFAGFLAAGYVLSINLNIVGLLSALADEYDHLPLDKLFGTIIVAAVGLMLYGFTRTHARLNELKRRAKAEERARRVAMHDQLTGLPNRRHLKGMLNWLLSAADGGRKLAVIKLDIDRFKAFNDTYGRSVGDELLQAVGKVLNVRAGVDGFVARLDADEFVVLLQDWDEDQLIDWLSALLTAIEAPIRLGKESVSIGATVGVAMALADGRDAETLLHRADLAMRRAKEKTRGWFAFFKAGMDERVHERAVFEHDLWNAVTNDEIEPHYQPLATLSDGQVRGYEVLARWTHPVRGSVSPAEFIPVAEAAGVIGELSINLLRKACREALHWEGAPNLSLNVSPAQLSDEALAQRILQALAETGFPARRLEIELTESAVVADFAAARAILQSLKNQGVIIALDNFGVGHTSLQELRELPFDKLKIDRSFIEGMMKDTDSAIMVRTMILMARSMGLTVVAEGVETPEQARALYGLGCAYAQGHLFGRAAAGEDASSAQPPSPAPPAPVEAPLLEKAG